MTDDKDGKIFVEADTASPETEESVDSSLQFIGEGLKYSTVEEADNSIAHAQKHISELEEENAKMRENLASAATLDTVLDRMSTLQHDPLDEEVDRAKTSPFSKEDVAQVAAQAARHEMESVAKATEAKANGEMVAIELTKRYGGKAKEMYITKAHDLGVNLDALALASPKAVLAMFTDTANTTEVVADSSVKTEAVLAGKEFGTKAYWDAMRKSGKLSQDECFKKQHEYLQKLGREKFYDK